MDLSIRFRLNRPRVISETIDEEAVMIDFDSGNYFSLNKSGADILGLIEGRATLGQIVQAVQERYKGGPEEIQEAVKGLLAELQQEDLIVPDAEDPPQPTQGQGELTGLDEGEDRPDFEPPFMQKFTDMQDLLLLDPIHEVDDSGWPSAKMDTPDEDE